MDFHFFCSKFKGLTVFCHRKLITKNDIVLFEIIFSFMSMFLMIFVWYLCGVHSWFWSYFSYRIKQWYDLSRCDFFIIYLLLWLYFFIIVPSPAAHSVRRSARAPRPSLSLSFTKKLWKRSGQGRIWSPLNPLKGKGRYLLRRYPWIPPPQRQSPDMEPCLWVPVFSFKLSSYLPDKVLPHGDNTSNHFHALLSHKPCHPYTCPALPYPVQIFSDTSTILMPVKGTLAVPSGISP